MLFVVKNHVGATLLLTAALALGSLLLRGALALPNDLALSPLLPLWIGGALACLIASDGVLHLLLWWGLGSGYQERYRTLAEYFRAQGPLQILAGGLLAGVGEELLFRGVLLAALWKNACWHPAWAVAAVSVLFALGHWLPNRRLGPFAVWAALQGVWIGALYVASGSLVACMVTHALHDIMGFTVFAVQRQVRGRFGVGPNPLAPFPAREGGTVGSPPADRGLGEK